MKARLALILVVVMAGLVASALPVYAQDASGETSSQPNRGCSAQPFQYGTSYGGRPLLAYRCGNGPSVRAIIGGIHGGYEWNTVVLVERMLAYLQARPDLVPEAVTLYIIPCANPDGYAAGTDRTHGRMNGNGVDLNRNWDYKWQPRATHGQWPVDAGDSPFSEPETATLRDLILDRGVEAAIFYHSAMARIFHGMETANSATDELAEVVSLATGYAVAASVPGQVTTGDAVDWMSAQGLAGIEVELTTHQEIEWSRNLRGLMAFLDWVNPKSGPADAPADLAGIATVTASSSLRTDRWGRYGPRMAVDGRRTTAWVEGARGAGEGEWLMLSFPEPVEIHSVGLIVGYDSSADLFYKNNRIKRATLVFSNGEQVELGFADRRGMQTVPLVRGDDGTIETTSVKIVIEEVYRGWKYNDTCIAEVKIVAVAR
jgi:hypothetical protein